MKCIIAASLGLVMADETCLLQVSTKTHVQKMEYGDDYEPDMDDAMADGDIPTEEAAMEMEFDDDVEGNGGEGPHHCMGDEVCGAEHHCMEKKGPMPHCCMDDWEECYDMDTWEATPKGEQCWQSWEDFWYEVDTCVCHKFDELDFDYDEMNWHHDYFSTICMDGEAHPHLYWDQWNYDDYDYGDDYDTDATADVDITYGDDTYGDDTYGDDYVDPAVGAETYNDPAGTDTYGDDTYGTDTYGDDYVDPAAGTDTYGDDTYGSDGYVFRKKKAMLLKKMIARRK